jgi:uncharacterized phage protein (TIGR01671 family)
MRELKFRYVFKCRLCGEIVTRIHTIEDIEKDFIDYSWHNCNSDYHACDLVNRDQFTGLPDKNGKEIYEGDIVDGSQLLVAGLVRWDDDTAAFVIDVGSGDYYEFPVGEDITVLGNIHHNPERLEGSP